MKKMTLLLMAMVMSLGIMAQDLPYINVNGDVPVSPKDNEFVCAPNSVFSQVYPTYASGYFSDGAHTYTRTADDYTTTNPFSSMRFWGVNYCGGAINATETFIIKFYERNTTDPSIPGVEVNSFTIAASITDMGLTAPWGCNTPMYQIDIDFGATVTLLDGWMSVTRQNPGDVYAFAMIASGSAGNVCSYNSTSDTWQTDTKSLMFCLGAPPPVPLSNWALIISMILISGFIVIRTRYSAA